jgi:hypothetical protein
MAKLTKKQKKKKIEAYLWESLYARRVWQEQPNTFVKFRVKIPPGKGDGTETIETFGFSKANWPDAWDEEYGIYLA